MSEPDVQVPAWSLGWRLQRALAHAGMTTEAMARELGVARSTISRWCNDAGAPPRVIYLRAWAHRCRVPVDWLLYGEDQLPRVDSNHQPAGWSNDLESVPVDRYMTLAEVAAVQRDWRGLIRRGTFGQLVDPASAARPIAGA